jgi:probable phosphoglycerate mutase
MTSNTGTNTGISPSDTTGTSVRIYVARHGQDEDNASGILNGHRDQPLTVLGEEQARTVAHQIQKRHLTFDAIYTSPLQRARRTAAILAPNMDVQVQVMDSLIERDFGILTGVPTKEIAARCKPETLLVTDTITYFLSPEGAETFPDLLLRAHQVIESVTHKHRTSAGGDSTSSNILLVTHGDFGKMIYAAFYKLDWQDVLRQFHFGNSEVLLLSNDESMTHADAYVFHVDQYNP